MRAALPPTANVSLRLPIGSGGNRFQQLHHRLVGPVIRVLVDLGVAADADRRVDVLALAEAVPELLHFVRRHVVGAAGGRFARHLSPRSTRRRTRTPAAGSVRNAGWSPSAAGR